MNNNELKASYDIKNMSALEVDALHSTYKYSTLNDFSKVIRDGMGDSKFDEEILAFVNTPDGYAKEMRLRNGNIISSIHEAFPVLETSGSFFNNDNFKVGQRRDFEYDVRFKQLCVATLIKSGNDIAVLSSKQGPLVTKLTMVQGHVAYDTNYFKMSEYEFIKYNAMKELEEETNIKEIIENYAPFMKLKYYININTGAETLLDICHVGYVFMLDLPKLYLGKIKSNEEDKHDIIHINLLNGVDSVENADLWLKMVLKNYLG